MVDFFARLAFSGPRHAIAWDFSRGVAPGVPFPPSYTDFVKRLGYGLLCNRFIVYPPLGHYGDSFYEQSQGIKWALGETLNMSDTSYDFLLEPDGSKELIPRLVGFATGENGESLFWDVKPNGPAEYPVYLSGRGMGIRYGGDDLNDFVARVTNEHAFKTVMRFDTEPLPLTFRSFSNPTFTAWLAGRG